MDEFLLRALLAGLTAAIVAAPFGCFVVWRQMAYFGDALAHCALLGLALALLLEWHPLIGLLAIGLLMALALSQRQYEQSSAMDTLLGTFAHSALAFGILVLSFDASANVDVMRYLFGDILMIRWQQWGVMAVLGAGALGFILLQWRNLLSMTINRSLAAAEGVPVYMLNRFFMFALAVVVAITMQTVGALLTTSLLIIPAATARLLARTPATMAIWATLLGCVSVLIGIGASWQWDLPTGPAIVAMASLGFFAGHGLRFLFRQV